MIPCHSRLQVYTGTLRLGEGTESYDAETPVTTSLPWEHVTDDALQAAVASLTGVIEQVGTCRSCFALVGVPTVLAAVGTTACNSRWHT